MSMTLERIEEWRGHLLDTSKRNRLVNFKTGWGGGIALIGPASVDLWRKLVADEAVLTFPWKRDLVDLPAEAALEVGTGSSPGEEQNGRIEATSTDSIALCLASPRLRRDHVLTSLTDDQLSARMKRLELNSREAESELGVNTLYVAFGTLRWYESEDSDEPVTSPLLLVPVRINRQTIESPWVIRPEEDEIRRNDTLAELMRSDHRVTIPQIEDVAGDPEDPSDLLERYTAAFAERVGSHRRWEVRADAAALGIFQFQKLAMWEDLGRNAERIAAHPLCRGIAGDREAIPTSPVGLPRAEELDERVPPEDVVHILDVDSSQQAALEAVKRGANLVLDGPPGTGKSQTIANLIAESLASGRTVLFVSEKAAALEVVKRRLDDCDLGDFCLDLHSHRANKRGVVEELGRCLTLPARPYPDPAERLRELADVRGRLNAYVRALHTRRDPLGLSAYQAHAELAGTTRLSPRTRCPMPDPLRVDGAFLLRVTEVLRRLPDCLDVIRQRDRHPWRGYRAAVYSLNVRDDLQYHVSHLAGLAPEVADMAEGLVRLGLAPERPDREALITAEADARLLLGGPLVPSSWFESDPRAAAAAMIALDVATRALRQVVPRLPEFSKSAVRDGGKAVVESLGILPDTGDLGLRDLPDLGVREAARRLLEARTLMDGARAKVDACGRAASKVGEVLMIGTGVLELRKLPTLVDVGRLALRAGVVPPGWWDDADRAELRGVADQATVQARSAAQLRRELLTVFVPDALDDTGLVACDAFPPIRADDGDLGDPTLAQLRGGLVNRRDALARIAEAAAAVEVSSRVLADLVGNLESPRPISRERSWAESVARAMDLAPIPGGLWDAARRNEARDAVAASSRLLAAAEAANQALGSRVTSAALAGAFDRDVAAALSRRSWLGRLLPGWRRARVRLTDAFPAGLPTTEPFLADLARLASRRKAIDEADRLAATHRDSWSYTPDGRPDLAATEAAIGRAAEAERLIAPTDRLREVMAATDASPRLAISSAAIALGRAISTLDEVRSRLGNSPPLLGHDAAPTLDQASPEDLRHWAETQAAKTDRHLMGMDATRSAMAPGVFDSLTRSDLARWVGTLKDYQERVGYVRGVARTYSERLGLTKPLIDVPDLSDAAERLRSIDGLVRVKLPEATRKAMAPLGSLDRERLASELAGLAEAMDDFRAAWGGLRGLCDVVEWDDPATSLPRCPAGTLAARLACRAEAINQALSYADRLIPLLVEGGDVPWVELPPRADALRDLVGLRARVETLRGPAKINGTPEEIEARDCSEEARLGESLGAFLDTWHRPSDPALARGLSDPTARAELQRLIDRMEAVRSGGFDDSWVYLTSEVFAPDQNVSTGIVLDTAPLDVLAEWLADRAADVPVARDWIRYRDVEHEATEAGVASVLDEVYRGEVQADDAAAAYRARFLGRWLDAIYEQVPELRRFESETHARLAARFADLDRLIVDSAPQRVRSRLLARPDRPSLRTDAPPKSSELGLLVGQVDKKRGHLPLRKLFAKISTILPRLKPCLMMSPLAVSTYLQSPDLVFDLVIFDEASQVRPHDAVSAIYRGRQLVVAGDQKQLPPSSFFEKSAEEDAEADEDADDLGDYESVLDVCCSLGMTRRRLRWHYRSRREGLIAFSNRFFYAGDLVTFPSVDDADGDAIRFEHVPSGRFVQGVNPIEARRVAELVIEHFRREPGKSLAVIAFSQRQQFRILDALDELRKSNPELEEFFREGRREPFFVKNLENVQGDERDAMILGVGYGPDDSGKVAMRFGPLNRKGGERRLNVAVTRARERMTLVSSLQAGDINLSRSGAEGVRLLRAYLDYAESGPAALARSVTEADRRDYDSPFEREVAEELQRRGLVVHRQVGCGGFRIDLGVVDPEHPGRYLLGVECDGATYHSSATARDRDRLRQEVLAGLGWHLCRVWSTDWLRDREPQVRRVLAAVERARSQPPATRRMPSQALPRPIPAPSSPAQPPARRFKAIAEVPEAVVRSTISDILLRSGATRRDELPRAVAHKLGFERTGKIIERRVVEAVEGMIRAGQLSATADSDMIVCHVKKA